MIVYTEFALVVEKYSHAPRIWSKGTKIDLLTPLCLDQVLITFYKVGVLKEIDLVILFLKN